MSAERGRAVEAVGWTLVEDGGRGDAEGGGES